jgi:hypothetical protein
MIISFNQHCFALGFDHQTRSSIRFQWSSWRRIHMPIDNSRRIGRPGRRPTLQNKASQSFSLSTTSTDRVPECTPPPSVPPLGRMDYRTAILSDRRPPAPAFLFARVNLLPSDWSSHRSCRQQSTLNVGSRDVTLRLQEDHGNVPSTERTR